MSVRQDDHPDRGDGHERAHGTGLTHCSVCGAAGYPDDRYCPCCGNTMLRFCPECGGEVRQPVAFYCTHCGASMGGAPIEK